MVNKTKVTKINGIENQEHILPTPKVPNIKNNMVLLEFLNFLLNVEFIIYLFIHQNFI